MDEKDDGRFHYDLQQVPLCVCAAVNEPHSSIKPYLLQYFHFNSKIAAPSHENALLDSGLTMGEAAVLYFRYDACKKRRQLDTSAGSEPYHHVIALALNEFMGIDVYSSPTTLQTFQKAMGAFWFTNQLSQSMKHLTTILKGLLQDLQLKSKGYTTQLRRVVEQVERYIQASQLQKTQGSGPAASNVADAPSSPSSESSESFTPEPPTKRKRA
jgi:hypothetical protein